MKRYCLALDLVNDAEMIAEYEALHKAIRPEIEKSILDAGVTQMEIFRIENRLFMIMETVDDFSFEKKDAMDAANPKVQEWENNLNTITEDEADTISALLDKLRKSE